VSTAFPVPLSVLVTDSSGAPMSGVPVSFAAPGSGASAALAPGNPVLTDALGIAWVNATANAIPGSYAVTASVVTGAGAPLTGTFNLANQSVIEVPALGPWGFAGLVVLLTAFALGRLRARRQAPSV
jgi:hypothetical protein